MRHALRAQIAAFHAHMRQDWLSSAADSPETQIFTGAEQDFDLALQQHHHLLVTGGAGVGKTTLAMSTVAQISRNLLDRASTGSNSAWIPVYVPAHLMPSKGSIAQWILTALRAHLSGLLSSSLNEALFKTAPKGWDGWIIFVDGADELANIKDRERLIDSLGQHLGKPHYRFVILTREIGEVRALRKHIGTHEISTLNDLQLLKFCREWLQRRGQLGVTALGLLQEARAKGVYDLLTTPLLASMACHIYAETASLPQSVIDLWERYVDDLLHARQERVKARAYLHDLFETYGKAGGQCAEWIYSNRRALCATIALEKLNWTRRSAITIGEDYIREHCPGFREPRNWSRHLEHILVDTGVFVRRGTEVDVAHYALAEYLASLVDHLDEELSEYQSPEHWYLGEVTYSGSYSYHNHANLRMLALARRNPNMFWTILHGLLGSDSNLRQYYAVELLARSAVAVDDTVVEKLRGFFNGGYRFLADEEYLALNNGECAQWVGGWDWDELDVHMAHVLGRLARKHDAFKVFLLKWSTSNWTGYHARLIGLSQLWSSCRSIVNVQLSNYLAERDPAKWLDVAEVYLAAGATDEARSLAQRTLTDPGHLWHAGELLFKCGDTGAAVSRLSDAFERSEDWELRCALARTMVYFDATDYAIELLRRRLQAESLFAKASALDPLASCGFTDLARSEWMEFARAGGWIQTFIGARARYIEPGSSLPASTDAGYLIRTVDLSQLRDGGDDPVVRTSSIAEYLSLIRGRYVSPYWSW